MCRWGWEERDGERECLGTCACGAVFVVQEEGRSAKERSKHSKGKEQTHAGKTHAK